MCAKAKTEKSLKRSHGPALRQGVLELLAGDDMRNCPGGVVFQKHRSVYKVCMLYNLSSHYLSMVLPLSDHMVVLVGDGNTHYGERGGEREVNGI